MFYSVSSKPGNGNGFSDPSFFKETVRGILSYRGFKD